MIATTNAPAQNQVRGHEQRARTDRVLDSVVLLALAVLAATKTATPISDNSYFTQMSSGKYALDSGTWPQVDVFTNSPGRWIAPGRLSSLFFALADELGSGALGRIVATASIVLAIALCWNVLSEFSILARTAIVSGFVLAEMSFLSQRAQTTGLALFVVTLLLVYRRRPTLLLVFAPVFAFWINWHGSWAFGIAVFVVGCAFHRLVAPAVLAVASTLFGALISPYGLDLVALPFSHIGQNNLEYIIEWQRPGIGELFTQVLVALALTALLQVHRGRRLIDRTTLVQYGGYCLVFLVASFSAQRNIMFALPVLLFSIAAFHTAQPNAARIPAIASPQWLARGCVALVAVLSILIVATPSYAYPSAPEELGSAVPDGATVLTDLDTGAWLQATRGPSVQLFVDDRGEMHSEHKFELWYDFRDGDAATVDQMEIDHIIWESENEALQTLIATGEWKLIGAESLSDDLELSLLVRQ